jgi:hypothetical protein
MKSKPEGIYFLILMALVLFLFNAPGCKTNIINGTENLTPEGAFRLRSE